MIDYVREYSSICFPSLLIWLEFSYLARVWKIREWIWKNLTLKRSTTQPPWNPFTKMEGIRTLSWEFFMHLQYIDLSLLHMLILFLNLAMYRIPLGRRSSWFANSVEKSGDDIASHQEFAPWLTQEKPERRARKPFQVGGKSWKMIADPWGGVKKCSFGLGYMKRYPHSETQIEDKE